MFAQCTLVARIAGQLAVHCAAQPALVHACKHVLACAWRLLRALCLRVRVRAQSGACGLLAQCTPWARVAEQLAVDLRLLAVFIASFFSSPTIKTCACTRALGRRVVAEELGGELGLALLAAVIAAAEHTLTVHMVVQPWTAKLGRVARPTAVCARERALLTCGEQSY